MAQADGSAPFVAFDCRRPPADETPSALATSTYARDHLARVLSTMRACENRDLFPKNSIPHEIREPMNNRPPNISIRNLVNEWSLSKTVNDLGDFGMELSAETTSLGLVPKLSFSNVKLGGATDVDYEAQRISRSRRAFTSGQGL